MVMIRNDVKQWYAQHFETFIERTYQILPSHQTSSEGKVQKFLKGRRYKSVRGMKQPRLIRLKYTYRNMFQGTSLGKKFL